MNLYNLLLFMTFKWKEIKAFRITMVKQCMNLTENIWQDGTLVTPSFISVLHQQLIKKLDVSMCGVNMNIPVCMLLPIIHLFCCLFVFFKGANYWHIIVVYP